MKMKLSNNYTFTNENLQKIISDWSNAKDFSQKALVYVKRLNTELKNAIDSKKTLSDPSIACKSGLRESI